VSSKFTAGNRRNK